MKSLRDYINLVEGQGIDEAGPYTAGQPAPAAPAKPAASTTAIPPQLANMKDAKPGQELYVNGTRYKFDPKANATRKPDGTYSFAPGWKVTAAPGDIFQLGDTRAKTSSNFTSPELGQATQAAQPTKSDPAVLKIQQALIAKGAVGKDGKPLKADGVMGPNTQFAQAAAKNSGGAAQPAPAQAGTPAAATSVDAAKAAGAVSAETPAASTPAAPEVNNGPFPAGSPQAAAYSKMTPADQEFFKTGADPLDQFILARAPNGGKPAEAPAQGAKPAPAAPAGTTQDMGDGSKMTVGPNGQVASTDSEGNPYVTGSNPNLPKNKAAAQAVAAANKPQAGGTGYPQGSMEESSFQNDELNRIVSLVQYR